MTIAIANSSRPSSNRENPPIPNWPHLTPSKRKGQRINAANVQNCDPKLTACPPGPGRSAHRSSGDWRSGPRPSQTVLKPGARSEIGHRAQKTIPANNNTGHPRFGGLLLPSAVRPESPRKSAPAAGICQERVACPPQFRGCLRFICYSAWRISRVRPAFRATPRRAGCRCSGLPGGPPDRGGRPRRA